MTRTYGLSLTIFAISVAIYAAIEWQDSDSEHIHNANDDISPAFIAESLNSTFYDKNGVLSHQVLAQRMEHYTELEFTHFELPVYTLHPKNGQATWQLRADEAVFYQNNRIIFEDNVVLTSSATDSLVKEINCKYLELDLTTNIITSMQEILIIGKDFEIAGSDLVIDLNSSQMALNNHEKSIYNKRFN